MISKLLFLLCFQSANIVSSEPYFELKEIIEKHVVLKKRIFSLSELHGFFRSVGRVSSDFGLFFEYHDEMRRSIKQKRSIFDKLVQNEKLNKKELDRLRRIFFCYAGLDAKYSVVVKGHAINHDISILVQEYIILLKIVTEYKEEYKNISVIEEHFRDIQRVLESYCLVVSDDSGVSLQFYRYI